MIKVEPISNHSELVDLLPEDVAKSAKRTTGKMPTVYVASDGENVAAIGLRYRRQGHSCELTWWYGREESTLSAALSAVIKQAMIEGRRRIEAYIEHELPEGATRLPQSGRGGSEFVDFLVRSGFRLEGHHSLHTKFFEDVAVLSWSSLKGYTGIAVGPEGQYTIGVNETTEKYLEKNRELYEKNREYYQPVDGEKTLAEVLQANYNGVVEDENVTVERDWDPKASK